MSGSKTDPDKLGMIWTSYERRQSCRPGQRIRLRNLFLLRSRNKGRPEFAFELLQGGDASAQPSFPRLPAARARFWTAGARRPALSGGPGGAKRYFGDQSVARARNTKSSGRSGPKLKLEASLLAEGAAVLADGQISLPPYAIAILR